MTSVLTNTGAMTALQTLRGINKNLAQTQNEISTGKMISSAKDNSAIWAISKVMESDVAGFKAIKSSLALGESSVAVARNASESVTGLLTEIKAKIIAAQEENVDRAKLQTDIEQLSGQIESVVGAAQFNGLNLINGSSTETVEVLSSLDRDSSGNVSASKIDVERQNLSVTTPVSAQAAGTTALADQATADAFLNSSTAVAQTLFVSPATPPYAADGSDFETIADAGSNTITIGQVAEGITYEIFLGDVSVNVVGGGNTLGSRTFQYVASADDGTAEVASNLASQISAFFGAATDASFAYSAAVDTTNANQIVITNGVAGGASNTTMNLGLRVTSGGTPGATASGNGLGALQNVDVTTDTGATGALAAIEGLIQTSIDAAAAFGSVQKRIEIQSDFVGKLSDSLISGIGSLVDADLEETSARLQALQVQQQLGIQSLSIANQAPQTILALFR